MKKMLKKVGVAASMAAAFVGAQAQAAIDVTAVGAEIEAAGTAASSTGTYVIAAVAAVCGIGLIIGLVRRI